MRIWPFSRESRAEAQRRQNYTTRQTERSYDQAANPQEVANASAALETCAGIYARAFASARVTGASPAVERAITPDVLARIGRDLIRVGECCHAIETAGGALTLVPVGDFDVQSGGYSEASWTYRATMYGPSLQTTRNMPGAAIVHNRYATRTDTPWRGVGPLRWADVSSQLMARVERSLSTEMRIPPNVVVPMDPGKYENQNEAQREKLDEIKLTGGAIHGVRHASTWLDKSTPLRDSATGWKPLHIHPDPPQATVLLRDGASMAIIAACGIGPSLVQPNADGVGQKEAWRRTMHGSISPLARLVEAELRAKLDAPTLALDFKDLFASDIVGRARAFGSMVTGGMDIQEAAVKAGLTEVED